MSEKNIYQRVRDIYSDLEPIAKTGRNEFDKYNYIEQGRVVAELRSLMAKHGVVMVTLPGDYEASSVTSQANKEQNKIVAKFTFELVNIDKPEDKIVIPNWIGESIDRSDKAFNKAYTSAQKYFLIKQFLISDYDPDIESPELKPTVNTNRGVGKPAKLVEDLAAAAKSYTPPSDIKSLADKMAAANPDTLALIEDGMIAMGLEEGSLDALYLTAHLNKARKRLGLLTP